MPQLRSIAPGTKPASKLEELLGAEAAQTFLESHWPERHFAAHPPATTLPAVLRGPALASLEALSRVYQGPVTFGRGAREARTASSDANAGSLYRMGLSVYLPDIDAAVTGATAWLRAIERALGVPAGCARLGAFASPAGDGIACHFDADDVISIQLTGNKIFHVAKVEGLAYPSGQQFGPGMLPGDELYPQAPAGFPQPANATFERIEMRPGSVLFLPRGTWHRSEAPEDSFSVSIGMRPPAAMERLLQRLRDLLLQDPAWRRPLYEANGESPARQALEERLNAQLRQLPAVLEQLRGADLVQPVTPALPLRADSRLQTIPMAQLQTTVLTATPRVRLTIAAWDDEWIARATLDTEVPAHLAPALAWLAGNQAAFDVTDFEQRFATLPGADLRQLLELLVRAGYLRLLWFPVLQR
jgi:ribosomal protein L16 Arg81 hydroxylase